MLMNFVRQERWVIQLFVILFCLFHCCMLFSGIIASADCEDELWDVIYWTGRLKELEAELEAVQAENPLLETLQGAGEGAVLGVTGGAIGGAIVGALLGPPGAALGAAKGALGGAVGGVVVGGIRGYFAWRTKLKDAERAVEKAKEALKKAKEEYDKNRHDDPGPTGSLSPYMGSPTNVQYGGTHDALFQASVAYDRVYWYILAPGETGYGTNVSTEEGDGAKVSSQCSFTAPPTPGTYTITAYAYFSDTVIENSYDIIVTQ